MRRHVAATANTQTTRTFVRIGALRSSTSPSLVDGRHRILERTPGRKVLSGTNPTLDLLVLQLVLDTALLATILLSLSGLRLPVNRGPENNILADGGRVEGRTSGMALFQPELSPCFALRNLRVHVFADNSRLDAARDFYFLALVVEAV